MKAVIVEIKGRNAAMLQDDGSIIKTKNKYYEIGDVVDMNENKTRSKIKIGVWIAVAAMLVMMFSVGVFAYVTPYYFVSLDVNPGIIMEVNLFERVIGIEAVNEEAAGILEELDLKNKDINDAISEVVDRIVDAGYLGQEGSDIVITAASKNEEKAGKLAQKLGEAAVLEALESKVPSDVTASAIGYEMVEQAKEVGITPGKYNIIVNLLGEEVGDNKDESVSELMSRFTNDRGAHGRAIAEKASGDEVDIQKGEDNDIDKEPAENAELAEQNAAIKAEEAEEQEKNAPVDTPASTNKASNAEELEDNADDKIPDDAGKPDDLPDIDDVEQIPDELPELPEVPAGGRP